MIEDVKNLTFIIDEPEPLFFVIDPFTQVTPEVYEGPYIVNPKFEEQKLETKNRLLQDDVTVLEIEVEKVTNLGGGYTVTIGG